MINLGFNASKIKNFKKNLRRKVSLVYRSSHWVDMRYSIKVKNYVDYFVAPNYPIHLIKKDTSIIKDSDNLDNHLNKKYSALQLAYE